MALLIKRNSKERNNIGWSTCCYFCTPRNSDLVPVCACSNAGKPDLEIIVSTVNRLAMFIALLYTVLACKVVKFYVWFHLDRFLHFKVI